MQTSILARMQLQKKKVTTTTMRINENTSTPTPESTSKNEEIVTDNELWKHRLEENKHIKKKRK